jgi:hypothetical protein
LDAKDIGIGRIVHFVLDSGEHRPGIVVRVWDNGLIQLQVFTDSDKDGIYNDRLPPVMWKTSVHFDETEKKPGTWHWPERVP